MLPLTLIAALLLPAPRATVPQQNIEGTPAAHRPLPATDRGAREIRGDFDSDGLTDRAALFEYTPIPAIAFWVFRGNGESRLLSIAPLNASTRDTVVLTRTEPGDPTCPRVVDRRRQCRRGSLPLVAPGMVVSSGPGREVVWVLNGPDAVMHEVFE